MTTYEQYLALRVKCGYDADFALGESTWNGCDQDAQDDMLRQLSVGAEKLFPYGDVW